MLGAKPGRLGLDQLVDVALVDRHPQHELTDSALIWLFHYYASYEMALRTGHKRHVANGPLADKKPAARKPSQTPLPADAKEKLILPEFRGGSKLPPNINIFIWVAGRQIIQNVP